MPIMLIATTLLKRSRERDAKNADYLRGQGRQIIARGLANDLSHIPLVGHRDVGTATVATWDLTKTKGVDPTPVFDHTGKRVR